MVQVVECLLYKLKALSSNPSPTQKIKRQKKRDRASERQRERERERQRQRETETEREKGEGEKKKKLGNTEGGLPLARPPHPLGWISATDHDTDSQEHGKKASPSHQKLFLSHL
jgi:chromatin remodeling complex protein RSC6